MKNSGLFLNLAKWYFWGVCFFEVLILKGLFLVCLVLFQKCQKCLFFPIFWVFSGVAHCCSSGFGRFRCFCVSCVCFSFLSCLCFCFVCFVLGFVVGCCCFFCLFFVVFYFCLFLFVFFGGFKGHVRWPEGPPHLALNPPYFICFFFFFSVCFVFFFFVFFVCFFWSHLT